MKHLPLDLLMIAFYLGGAYSIYVASIGPADVWMLIFVAFGVVLIALARGIQVRSRRAWVATLVLFAVGSILFYPVWLLMLLSGAGAAYFWSVRDSFPQTQKGRASAALLE